MKSEIVSLLHGRGVAKYFCATLRSRDQRRHAVDWLRTLEQNYLLDEGIPWITFDAIDYLEDSLTSGVRVFEYGSGGSTVFWHKFSARCVSVEHDPVWFARVQLRLGKLPSYLIDYRLVVPSPFQVNAIDTNNDASDPEGYLSMDERYSGFSFQKYVSQIDDFPDLTFDVVLIDGRARPSCIAHSTSKVQIGGFLILDNAERAYYTARTKQLLTNFDRRVFYGVGPIGQWRWQTDVYIRQR